MSNKTFLFIFIFHILSIYAYAQRSHNDREISSPSGTYAISKTANYFSFGIGRGYAYHLSTLGFGLNYSFAIKGLLISVTRAASTSDLFGLNLNERYYSEDYFAVMVGCAFRNQNMLISVSTGGAYTFCKYTTPYLHYPYTYTFHKDNKYSIPADIKFFFLADRIFGIGIVEHVNINKPYTSSLTTLSVVFGNWNDKK